jgi:pimeloyl-ACP methyl ester carboxylesterase
MTQHDHQTAPTQFVEPRGIRFAYRRFGNAGGVPLVFNQHFTGTMDHWDPAVTDGLAKDREVILFNNAGVSSSSGDVPTTFEEMGANAIAFIKALGLKQVDVLGFSIGGFVAQEITVQAPELVRREHGDPHAGSAADLRRHLQGAGGDLVEGPLHRLGSQQGRRPGIPEALLAPH